MDSQRFEIESEAWYRAVAEGRLPAVTDRALYGAQGNPGPPAPGQGPASGRESGPLPSFGPYRP